MTVALLEQGVEIVAGLFRFLCGPPATFESVVAECDRSGAICYCIDDEMVYEPFFGDFGPLNLGHTYNFCKRTNDLLQAARKAGTVVYFYCGPHPWRRANASVLVGIWQVLYLERTAEQAYAPLAALPPCEEFRDASSGASLLPLTVLDVIQGMARAKAAGFVDWHRNPGSFDAEAYLHYEQVQNGDLNWVVPGKLLAFAGPTAVAKHFWGYRTFTPEDYHQYFADTGVTAVVRLNNELYKQSAFTKGGFRHFDLFFVDGSCPSSDIVLRFLDIVEGEPGGVAVHCKAGLGRTGVLICCYMMKHHGFTAKEAIAYIRICRPGSVIGPQQTFLHINEAELWKHGELYRQHQKEKEAAAMRKAADAVAANALTRAVAKRTKASSGLVVDIVASATFDAVHTWPMDTEPAQEEQEVSASDSNCSSATANPVRQSGRQSATQGVLPRTAGAGRGSSSGGSAGHKIGARIAAGAAALTEFLSGGAGQIPAASSQTSATVAVATVVTTPARGARRSAAAVGLTPPSSRRPNSPASEDTRSGSSPSNPPSVGSRFLAENGQPRKGLAAPSPNSKARRGLSFAGLEPAPGWSIGSVKQ